MSDERLPMLTALLLGAGEKELATLRMRMRVIATDVATDDAGSSVVGQRNWPSSDRVNIACGDYIVYNCEVHLFNRLHRHPGDIRPYLCHSSVWSAQL